MSTAPPQAYLLAAVLAVCLYLLRQNIRRHNAWRIMRLVILAGGIAGTGAALVVGVRKLVKTPVGVAAVPPPALPVPSKPDAGDHEARPMKEPHSMNAEIGDDTINALVDSMEEPHS